MVRSKVNSVVMCADRGYRTYEGESGACGFPQPKSKSLISLSVRLRAENLMFVGVKVYHLNLMQIVQRKAPYARKPESKRKTWSPRNV